MDPQYFDDYIHPELKQNNNTLNIHYYAAPHASPESGMASTASMECQFILGSVVGAPSRVKQGLEAEYLVRGYSTLEAEFFYLFDV